MLKLIKNNTFLAASAIYLMSNILNATIPFILLPILTRYLTPEEYGEVAIFQTLLSALAAFVGLSMHGAAGRKFYDGNLNEKELSQFIGSCLQILIITSSITFFIILLLGRQLINKLTLDIHWVLLAVIVTASTVIIQLRLGQWQVRKSAKIYGIFQVSHSALNFGLSLLLVIMFSQTSDGRITAQVLAAVSFALIALWLLNRDKLLTFFVWHPRDFYEIFRFGFPLVPHVLGVFLLASFDRFVISTKLGLDQAGLYMVAVQFSAALGLVFDAVNKAYVPWLYERLKEDVYEEKRQIVMYAYLWCGFIFFGAIMSFFFVPSFIKFVAGVEYSRAGDVAGWLVLGQVFGGMYLMVTNYIFYSKRTGLLSAVTMFSGILNVSLLYILVDKFGLEGAAYAFCIAMLVRFSLTWVVAQQRHPMPWFDLFESR